MEPYAIPACETRPVAQESWWRKALVPSFADFLFVALIIWVFLAGANGWNVLLGDGDTGWHIRTGERVLATGAVPTTDEFSFTKPGAEWYAWEWLSDVVYAFIHRWGGLQGVALFAGALVALYGVLLVRFMVWKGANTLLALFITLLAFGASSLHFLARPHLFTLVGLVGVLWLLERDRTSPTRAIWLLIPLTALWANLHAGFVVLFPILGCLVVGSALEAWLGGTDEGSPWWRQPARYSTLSVGCAAASLINPFGVELHRHILNYLQADWIRDAVQEFQAPSFRHESHLQFELLLFCGLLASSTLLARRRFVAPLWIILWAHLALGSARHIPIFVIVASPVIAYEATRLWNQVTGRCSPKSLATILNSLSADLAPGFRRSTVWCVVFLLVLGFNADSAGLPKTFSADQYPITMIEQHAELIRTSRIFTNDEWADYLLYRFYPYQRVFFDGRSDFYGEQLLGEFMSTYQGGADWSEVLDKYGCDLVFVPPDSALASLLKNDGQWRLVDKDERAVLYTRLNLVP